MIYNKTTWCFEMQTKLQLAKESFKPKEIERSGIEYLSNLFSRIESGEIEIELDLQRKIDSMMKEFPKKVAGRFLITSSYINQLSSIKKIIMKRYNLIAKGDLTNKNWIVGFIPLGFITLAIVFKAPNYVFLMIPIVFFGMAIVILRERKARKENRVL